MFVLCSCSMYTEVFRFNKIFSITYKKKRIICWFKDIEIPVTLFYVFSARRKSCKLFTNMGLE